MKRRHQEPDAAAPCQVCGHPYSDHRGKRGCTRPLAKLEFCPCSRFAAADEKLHPATTALWSAMRLNGELEPAADDKRTL